MLNAAIAVLKQHEWPGNVRELANLIERLAIIHPKGLVDVTDLPEKFQKYQVPEGFIHESSGDMILDDSDTEEQLNVVGVLEDFSSTLAQLPEQGIDLKEYLNVLEVDLIRQALNECNGIVAHAAKRLNMRRTTLVEKIRKYDFQR